MYLLIGCVATIAVSFVMPNSTSQNQFLYGSVFLAFAFLYPDFELYIFFILPLKIKWIALLTWIGYFVTLIFGSWLSRLLVLASLCNFLLFFHRDILEMIRTGRRRMAMQTAQLCRRPRKSPSSIAAPCAASPIAPIPTWISAIAANATAPTAIARNICTITSISSSKRKRTSRDRKGAIPYRGPNIRCKADLPHTLSERALSSKFHRCAVVDVINRMLDKL